MARKWASSSPRRGWRNGGPPDGTAGMASKLERNQELQNESNMIGMLVTPGDENEHTHRA
ncbi:MAG: hypothetical protein DMG57_29285 [Acidobacteria bacterium]|nr:MAG: hypothetical protein DMG57_29285 [Acidobacteriota bacterium]